jgi:hypothetical protein
MPLSFPTSGLPEAREIQFRDGKRVVPEYLADMMAQLDTARYSYEEAVSLVNNSLSRDHANKAMDQIVANHFRGGPR